MTAFSSGAKKNIFHLVVSALFRTFVVVIELQRHIEILLLDNDCVIVPDVGGFVAYQENARYDANDHMFLPPLRSLGFNPQLRINDSLLAQSYVTAYDISYPEALKRIESDVDAIRRQLNAEGSYQLDGIGLLTVNSEGNFSFEPTEAGILSPQYYGLGSVYFPTLREHTLLFQEKSATPQEEDSPEPAKDPTLLDFIDNGNEGVSQERAIQIKMSWVRNAVAVAAAVVAFFLMVTPIANSNLNTRSMTNLQNDLLQKLMPSDSNMLPAQPVSAQAETSAAAQQPSVPKEKVSESAKPETPPEAPVAAKPAACYCIVLASQVKRSNAEYYVGQLKKRGYAEAEVFVHNNVVRVVYGSFATEGEAYRQLNRMAADKEFAEAWVYKKPTEV